MENLQWTLMKLSFLLVSSPYRQLAIMACHSKRRQILDLESTKELRIAELRHLRSVKCRGGRRLTTTLRIAIRGTMLCRPRSATTNSTSERLNDMIKTDLENTRVRAARQTRRNLQNYLNERPYLRPERRYSLCLTLFCFNQILKMLDRPFLFRCHPN